MRRTTPVVRYPEPAGCGINDRTWDDLNMDDAFSVLDRTESVVGQQVLCARLRAVPVADHLAAFEALVTRMGEDPQARERAQLALGRLRACGGWPNRVRSIRQVGTSSFLS